MFLHVMVSEEISDEPVDGHPESAVKEVDEDYDLSGIRGRHILAKGTPVTQKLPWHQEPPTTRFLMSSSVMLTPPTKNGGWDSVPLCSSSSYLLHLLN